MTSYSGSDAGSSQESDIQDSKFFAAVGYSGSLCFVPLPLKKDSKFAQFHGRQALILFIMELAALVVKIIPVLGDLVFTVAIVALGVLSLLAAVKVLMGECWEVPVIHDISTRVTL